MVCAGLMLAALVFALSADVRQFEGAKVCRGSFSSDFGTGFNVRRGDLIKQLERYRSCADAAAHALTIPATMLACGPRTGDRMKRREFIVLIDGAGAASQDGSIASVYLRPCDPGDRMLRWHPRQ